MTKHHTTGRKCPHFRGGSATLVCCRCWMPDAVFRLAFGNRANAKAYKHRYCYKDCESCAMYHTINAAIIDT